MHVRLLKTAEAVKAMEVLAEAPLAVAVTVAVLALVTVEAVTAKVAVLAPDATVTEAGVASNALLSASVTTVPADGAALFSVTVQELVPPDASEAGLQLNATGVAGTRRLNDAVAEEPLKLAVITAVLGAVTAAAVAAKVAVLLPAATVTEAGTVTELLLSERVTTVPPVGAAPVKITVHVAVAAPVSDAGVQLSADTSTDDDTVTTALVAEVANAMAVEEAADALVT